MRLLYIDIDTLRPDHLGCYGYHRATSPNIDSLAARATRFDAVYVSDSPCLPSRTALWSGRFGLRTGVVNHGGRRAELYPDGPDRRRQASWAADSWPARLRSAGMATATISTFAERHSAYHWYAGFGEAYSLGTDGAEIAPSVFELAADWLRRRGRADDWFLHVHFWDPHTPYRTPAEFGDPFGGDPPPGWITPEVLAHHRTLPGPHTAQEITGWAPVPSRGWRQPVEAADMSDVRAVFDGYDTAVAYVDSYVGRLLNLLADLGVAEETAVLVSSDHGENLGELGVYCDHQTADQFTHHVPFILSWPGRSPGVDTGLHYQFDLAAEIAERVGAPPSPDWDGRAVPREHLVLSCGAWTVQRSVRFERWLCIFSYHDGYHEFPEGMLFDLEADGHEQRDLAPERPELVARAASLLHGWWSETMDRSGRGEDGLWAVVAEGGGLYVRGPLDDYLKRLADTGREDAARRLFGRTRPVGIIQ